MKKRVSALIIDNEKILLIRRLKDGRDYYVFPGGGVEKDENIKDAILREVREELGLEAVIEKPIFNIQNQGREEYYFLVKEFNGKLELGSPEKERANANNQYQFIWLNIADIDNLDNLFPEEAKNKISQLFRDLNPA